MCSSLDAHLLVPLRLSCAQRSIVSPYRRQSGEFNLSEFGIVRFEAPITFRYALYDPKRTDSATGADVCAEVIFKKYVAKDRHGADLCGDVYDNEDLAGSGLGDERHEGGMTPSQAVVKTAHYTNL